MKKFMKICGILSLILIVVGIVMISTAGIVKGPEMISSLKQNIANGLDSLDLLEDGVNLHVTSDMAFESGVAVYEGSVSQDFSADEIENLDVEAGTCQLNILPSEDGDFHVDVEKAGTYQGYVSDGTLYLRLISSTDVGLSADDSEFNLNLQVASCKLDLYVPENFYFSQAELSLAAGTISGSTPFKTDDLEIELAAGEIGLSNLEIGFLNAKSGAGTLQIKGSILEGAEVKCGMGEVDMELSGRETDFNYDIEVAAGDVTIGKKSFGGLARERNINNNAPRDITVECSMGSVDISFAE